jgi:chitin deacetylase
LAAYAKKKKNVVVMWSVSSADTVRGVSAQRIINNVLAQSQNGGIVLLHDGGGPRKATMKALPNIIAGLKKKGFKFVTVPELLEMHDKELKLAAAAKSASPVVVPPRSPIKETKSQKP